MDFQQIGNSIVDTLSRSAPIILSAIGILVGGWIVAILVRWVVRNALKLVKLNRMVKSGTEKAMDLEGGIATGAYYLILVMALIGFFNVLKLNLVSAPLQALVEKVMDFLPNLVAGGVLAIVAWVLATVVRKIGKSGLAATNWDEKISTGAGMKPVSESVADILYWLILLLFLPAILGALKLEGLLDPVQGMVDKTLDMLPNIAAAALLGFVGWFLANLLRNLVSNLLSATGADALGERAGLKGNLPLSKLVGLIVFIFVFVPALIAALNALKIDAIAGPATAMLSEMMAAIPNIFVAGLILAVAFAVSRFVGEIIAKLLGGIGFDRVPAKLGLGQALPESVTPSRFVGRVIVFFIMLFATVEAASVLGFHQISDLVAMMIEFGGQVLLGVAIIVVGLWIANLAHGAISRQTGANAPFYAGIARIAILGIVFAMGLNAMGLAPDIVQLAFGLTLGAVAVAIALSFGLGGREAAGKQMEHWFSRLRGGSDRN